MSVDINTTLNQITALPVRDQIELLHQVWHHLIDSGWEPELTDEQKAEFNRRLDDLDANPQSSVPLEKLIEHVRQPR
jgi:putative addiction module component (TIGR02574 family)